MSLTPRQQTLGSIAFLIAATIVVYCPALRGEFILDDDMYLTDASLIKAPDGLFRYWFTREAIDYYPVSNSTLWLEWRLWGMNPTGYHITNVLLHIGSALLVWRVLWKLSIPGAYWAALLFALHPINVESVAWIAQRKGLLAILFFLSSILCYLREERRREAREKSTRWWKLTFHTGRWYWFSLLMFILALFSKGSVAILPPVLLLIIWWQRRWIALADLMRIAPFVAVAIVGAAINVSAQSGGSLDIIRHISFSARVLGAGATVWFYLAKAFLPIQLALVYFPWDIRPADWLWRLPLLAAAVVTGILWWQRNSTNAAWMRSLLFAWVFFGLVMAPVMGFTDVGFMRHSLVADHYLHIALIGIVALVAAGLTRWQTQAAPEAQKIPRAVAVVVTAALAFLSWQQSRLFNNPIDLYSNSLNRNSTSWMLHNNLGLALDDAGKTQAATEHYLEALRLNPDYPEAHNNLGRELYDKQQTQEAIEQYKEALRLKMDYPIAQMNLGNALYNSGHPQEALEHYQFAKWLKPDSAEIHYSLAKALKQLGRTQEAIEQYREALRLKPNFPVAHNNLGLVLKQMGRLPEAIEQYQAAFQAEPAYTETLVNLATAYAKMNRPEEAIATAEKALELARSQEKAELVKEIEEWLSAYRADFSKGQSVPSREQ